MPFFVLPMLVACDQVNDLKDQVSGLTNPLVMEGILLGVAEPDSPDIDLSGTDFSKGTAAQVFLADAASAADIENAPVSGATVKVRVGDGGAILMTETESGSYTATGDDGLAYQDSVDGVVLVDVGGSSSSVAIPLPRPPQVDLPAQQDPGQKMVVDLTDYAYQAVLGVVVDVASGDVTWSNQPEGVQEIYDFTHSGDMVRRLEIPGSAFPDRTLYAVGLAGLVTAGTADFDNLNTALSSFMGGQFEFYPVSTIQQ